MKKLAGMITALVLAEATVAAQDVSRLYSRPAVPPQEVLDRLNLKLAWRTYLPVDGRRDGFATVQMLGKQILVQMRSGTIVALNADNGDTQWRANVGLPYLVNEALGFNARSVFVVQGNRLFALERATGQLEWEFILPNAASAAPVADAERIYLSLTGGRLVVYVLPKPDSAEAVAGKKGEAALPPAAPEPKPDAPPTFRNYTPAAIGPLSSARDVSRELVTGPQPQLLWSHLAGARLERAPLLTPELVMAAGTEGSFVGLAKENRELIYHFRTDAPVATPLGQHGSTAYVAFSDYSVSALDLVTGRTLWRFTLGAPLVRKPEVTDEDVFVTPDPTGLYRIDRATGDPLWRNPHAGRFLAVNKKFVYAADRSNRLLILDRARGTQLAVYDTRDFVFPVSNEMTDRLFLAANDGLLVCLHDRDYATPLANRKIEEKKAEPKAKPEPKPPADEKGEENK